MYLIVKSLRSSRSFKSISSSSSFVRDLTSPFSSVFAENKLCRSVGISCCLRKAWSSGCVILSKLCPYKSDWIDDEFINEQDDDDVNNV